MFPVEEYNIASLYNEVPIKGQKKLGLFLKGHYVQCDRFPSAGSKLQSRRNQVDLYTTNYFNFFKPLFILYVGVQWAVPLCITHREDCQSPCGAAHRSPKSRMNRDSNNEPFPTEPHINLLSSSCCMICCLQIEPVWQYRFLLTNGRF